MNEKTAKKERKGEREKVNKSQGEVKGYFRVKEIEKKNRLRSCHEKVESRKWNEFRSVIPKRKAGRNQKRRGERERESKNLILFRDSILNIQNVNF